VLTIALQTSTYVTPAVLTIALQTISGTVPDGDERFMINGEWDDGAVVTK
jgi:hypothetical protein